MEPSQSQVLCEPLLAALPQLKEKPCLGVRTWNPALRPGQFVGNSRTAMGLRFRCSGTVSDPVEAPSNAAPWYKNTCVTNALEAGALSVGIDSIGLIPEAGGIARIIGHGAGYRGIVADQAGYRVVNAFGKSTSTASGLNGLFDTSPQALISTGLTVAGFIPGLGQLAAGASIVNDAIKTGIAISKCP
jgi:hypothetical protein